MLTESNCLIAQSGGPTTAINASLAGTIEAALGSAKINTIFGSVNGILGVFEENFLNLTDIYRDNQNSLEQLKTTPAMFLGSCRYKLDNPEQNSSDYSNIFHIFRKYNIKYFFYIGGNDSMDTVLKLSTYAEIMNFDVRIIGIPKTIDNDIKCIDHTPGYGSAAKYIASTLLEIAHDAYIYPVNSVTIVEIMGRNAGWLTAAAALARNEYSEAPHLIYLPEKPFSTSRFIADIKDEFNNRKHVIVAVSEGIKDQTGTYISANSEKTDQFGHVMLNGTGKYLENVVLNSMDCKVRSIELNVLQRCASHLASLTDINEAYLLGKNGVNAALNGESGKMSSLTRISTSPYEVKYHTVPISDVANYEKPVPSSWISEWGNDVNPELIEYMRPLIQGETKVKYENGVPVYFGVEHLID